MTELWRGNPVTGPIPFSRNLSFLGLCPGPSVAAPAPIAKKRLPLPPSIPQHLPRISRAAAQRRMRTPFFRAPLRCPSGKNPFQRWSEGVSQHVPWYFLGIKALTPRNVPGRNIVARIVATLIVPESRLVRSAKSTMSSLSLWLYCAISTSLLVARV